ncbi:hypothetical protein AB0F03_13080 [Streptomyces sp. NPDC028722]|uniref:hypothetical protein n=1 Tax=unclassified Streptomyces TaxID=2593676 RepID=UPI0033D07BA9
MSGRTSAPYARPHAPLRPTGASSPARGVIAAVVAATTLLLAANAGPARAATPAPASAPAPVVRTAAPAPAPAAPRQARP